MTGERYQFKATKASEIDLQRVVGENDNASIILVRAAGDEKGLLLVNEGFLTSYVREDGLTLAGKLLCESWGSVRGSFETYGNGLRVYAGGTTRDYVPAQWRCTVVGPQERKALKREILKLSTYKRGVKVKVRILG
jgi:hypothetical protein